MRKCQTAVCLLVMWIMIAACQSARAASLTKGAIAAPTRTPPPVPTHIPLTSTPTPTSTFTSTPTLTFTPSSTPTLTLTPTATFTPSPTKELPFLSNIVIGSIPVYPGGYTVHLTGISPYLHTIFDHGQKLGRDRHRFSKIGDCQSDSQEFLQPIDWGDYKLGDYGYLSGAISYFQGSFGHIGVAAIGGIRLNNLLDPMWADSNYCDAGENSIECEVRLHNPSIMIISVEAIAIGVGWRSQYYNDLKQTVQYLIDQGIIPVLSTQGDWLNHDAQVRDINKIIMQVGSEYAIPVWDLHATTTTLPNRGDRGDWHLTILKGRSTHFNDPKSLNYGMTIRNLEALQVLDILINDVLN